MAPSLNIEVVSINFTVLRKGAVKQSLQTRENKKCYEISLFQNGEVKLPPKKFGKVDERLNMCCLFSGIKPFTKSQHI